MLTHATSHCPLRKLIDLPKRWNSRGRVRPGRTPSGGNRRSRFLTSSNRRNLPDRCVRSDPLNDSYPQQLRIEAIELYRISADKTLFFRGQVLATPLADHGAELPLRFSFWMTMDELGIRVTRIEPDSSA